MDITFQKEWCYRYGDNPYNDKLASFGDAVLRDQEAEGFSGRWCSEVFKRPEYPLYLEIGSGYGHFMREFCQHNPDVNFVGLDYRFKRSYNLVKRLDGNNWRYLRAKGERVSFMFAPGEVDRIFYFFPDPWPKRRHKKRRLFGDYFLKELAKILKTGGQLYIKTDHDDYVRWMEEVIRRQSSFFLELKSWNVREEHPEHFLSQYMTKFEKIFVAQNKAVKGLVLRKI